jgi:muramoyltetrapeptide carboxypeptidase
MSAMRLNSNDAIGLVSPCQMAIVDYYSSIIHGLKQKGFQVKLGENIYKNTYGYLASETERADDINKMVLDDNVKMIFFGGGEGSNEVLPYLDYNSIERHPKIFLSYSDGTSILDTIYLKTGLITFYGQTPGIFSNIQNYDYEQFVSNFVDGNVKEFKRNSKWYSLNKG